MSNSHSSALQDSLTLARQDELNAITTLLNRSLNPRGITARVGWNNSCLGILLEAVPVPDQEEMIVFIRQNLANLQLKSIRLVKVCGYQPGQSLPAWYEEIELEETSASLSAGYYVPSLTSWLNQGVEPSAEHQEREIGYDALSPLARSKSAIAGIPSNPTLMGGVDTTDELRFLRFYFNENETALLPLSSIQQVLKVPVTEILPVPHMPNSVLGIYNWRGEMLWLVDLAQQLGFPSTLTDFRALETITAIAIQTENKFLGIVVQQLKGIEVYGLQQLQPPTAAFPAKLLTFMRGYFASSSSPVLDEKRLIQDPLLQVHCPR